MIKRAFVAAGLLGGAFSILALDAAMAQTKPSATSPATLPTTQVSLPAAPAFKTEVLADHLIAPWSIAFLPDGRALFTERAGRVRIISADLKLLPEPALVVPVIKAWIKMGLLGITIDPDFATNKRVYTAECYGSKWERDSWVRVVRYELDGGKLVAPTTLIQGIPAFLNHAGGRLAFGPDRKLYITTGDADQPMKAQDKGLLNGKILRINTDGSIPSDNPFVNDSSANPAVWSYGHRNSQGLAFQPGTGTLFNSEHGPNGGDEVNRIERGLNYGWPIITHDRKRDGMVSPLAEFSPAIGPGDAQFYDGAMFPELKGDLLVACMRGEGILRIRLDDAGQHITHVERLLYHQFGRVREVKVAPDGALWITTSEFDAPEGRNTKDYDQVIRLTRGEGVAGGAALPDAQAALHPVGAVALYAVNCASCHGDTAQRAMNSSLFDGQWIYGKEDNDLRKNIRDGILDRGMPSYAKILSDDEIEELVKFIRIREDVARQH